MLTKQENELLTRVGPGTPMGDLLRQYWIPVVMSSDLAKPDDPPIRVKLLGENLVAFRDSSGQVGLLGENCSHRATSLFFGRNEQGGLRCIYHGWKYDIRGRCVDMPNEPPGSTFKNKIRHPAYPCTEKGGVVWTYMGPRKEAPPLPELEWLALPDNHRLVLRALRDCNWLQSLEGDTDSSHIVFLHSRLTPEPLGGSLSDRYLVYLPEGDRYTHTEIVETDYGVMGGFRRTLGDGRYHWRISQYMFPFYTLFPPTNNPFVPGHMWVPIDDEHTMVWLMVWNPLAPLEDLENTIEIMTPWEYLPATSDPLSKWRLAANKSNDYFIDYEAQRSRRFCGVPTLSLQDWTVTESAGAIQDRTKEHLGTTDVMIAKVRRHLIRLAKALRERGDVPPTVDNPELYHVRSASIVLPEETNWVEASKDLVKGFTDLPVSGEVPFVKTKIG